MNTADEMRQLAEILERGVTADIWYDADHYSDEAADNAIGETQYAMTRAAALLRQLADPTRQLTDTERAVLRGMLP